MDPDGGRQIVSPGRTQRLWLRSSDEPYRHVMCKSVDPRRAAPYEIYSLGMERVVYHLACGLDLPVAPVHLEDVNGAPSSLHWSIPGLRTHHNAGSCPMLRTEIKNQAEWPMMATFDIWIANVDRCDRNLGYEPWPSGTSPGHATSCRTWLIDHGYSGLFPPAKFGRPYEGRDPGTVDLDGAATLGEHEKTLTARMPPEYRLPFVRLDPEKRQTLLDRIRAVPDDVIEEAVAEIPAAYMTRQQADRTAEMLKRRRDGIAGIAER